MDRTVSISERFRCCGCIVVRGIFAPVARVRIHSREGRVLITDTTSMHGVSMGKPTHHRDSWDIAGGYHNSFGNIVFGGIKGLGIGLSIFLATPVEAALQFYPGIRPQPQGWIERRFPYEKPDFY